MKAAEIFEQKSATCKHADHPHDVCPFAVMTRRGTQCMAGDYPVRVGSITLCPKPAPEKAKSIKIENQQLILRW